MSAGGYTVAVEFSIFYNSSFGQNLAVCGSHPYLGSWNPGSAFPLKFERQGRWIGTLNLKFRDAQEVADFKSDYKFVVRHEYGDQAIWEEQENRSLSFDFQDSSSNRSFAVKVIAHWRGQRGVEERLQLRAPFTQVYYRRAAASVPLFQPAADLLFNVRFEVSALRLLPGSEIHIVGSTAALGNWSEASSIALHTDKRFPFYSVNLQLPRKEGEKLRYKYLIKDKDGKVVWEAGDNRALQLDLLDKKKSGGPVYYVVDDAFRYPFYNWRAAGVAVPIFSLRSEDGCGVGEFLDLKKTSEWLSLSGFRLLQLLPINDTCIHFTWWDSYPYSSLSVFALHPMYVNLEAVIKFYADDKLSALLPEISSKKKELNALDHVNYEEVVNFKTSVLRKIFAVVKDKIAEDASYQKFLKENEDWLRAYSLFCSLREIYGTTDYNKWTNEAHRNITAQAIKNLTEPGSERYESVLFYNFVQYHLEKQLLEAVAYANSKGIVLKGDLPIGVDPLSVDTWANRHLFRMQYQTGAPPDYFSTDGQNWGFPTYDWDVMSRDNYAWWRMRLKQMAKFFQAYRIDHILGFFRIWEIPGDCVRGLLGRFLPSIGVHKNELLNYGLWEFDRYTQPSIRDRHVMDLPPQIRDAFLEKIGHDSWRFKSQYNSEKAVEIELGYDGTNTVVKNLLQHIRDRFNFLLGNVVLIRDHNDHDMFYPRIEMAKTESFNELPWTAKKDLTNIYYDYFYKRQNDFWSASAMRKLPMMIEATNMLVCGEDLGMIPDCVPGVLSYLNILSLKIERMPSDPTNKFDNMIYYPYTSVCTPSVHDTSNLREWWEEDWGSTQQYYNEKLCRWGEAPRQCPPDVVKQIVENHLNSNSMLAIFPLQDIFAMFNELRHGAPGSERINVPANRHHYWKYRMHINIEQLLHDTSLAHKTKDIRALVSKSGRLADY